MDKEDVVCVCVYIHTYTKWNISHKKNEILPFEPKWMDLEGVMLSEINQRQILYDFTYMCNLKKKTNEQT